MIDASRYLFNLVYTLKNAPYRIMLTAIKDKESIEHIERMYNHMLPVYLRACEYKDIYESGLVEDTYQAHKNLIETIKEHDL